MIKFVICDDNEQIVEKVRLVVNKTMMPYDYDYKISRFKSYNESFEKIIKDQDEQKIYILDIELPLMSGLDIAEKIRKYDWNSIIIMLTAHNECKNDVFTSRLMVLDYISKYNKYEQVLEKTLKTALSIMDNKKVLTFKYNYTTHRIPYGEILYIKASYGKNSTIYTQKGKEYEIHMPLKELIELLKPYFYQSHRNCIINVTKVRKVKLIEESVVFKNGLELKLLSKRCKKGFDDYVRNF